MIIKPLIAAGLASGLMVSEKPSIVTMPRPAIVKAENLDFTKTLLKSMMPLGIMASSSDQPGIQFVGCDAYGKPGSSGPYPDNPWALFGGLASVPKPDDFMVCIYNAVTGTDYSWGQNFTAYGLWVQQDLYANDTNDTNLGVYTGFVPNPVPAGWPMPGTGGSLSTGIAAVMYVFRNVHLTTWFDVPMVPATGTNTGVPPSQSITPITAGAVAVFCAAASGPNASNLGNANLSHVIAGTGASTTTAFAAIGQKPFTSGPVVSGAWSGGPGAAVSNSWASCALALRPRFN